MIEPSIFNYNKTKLVNRKCIKSNLLFFLENKLGFIRLANQLQNLGINIKHGTTNIKPSKPINEKEKDFL